MIALSRHSATASCFRTSLLFLTVFTALAHLLLSLQALGHLSSASGEAARDKGKGKASVEEYSSAVPDERFETITGEQLRKWFGSENVFPAFNRLSRNPLCYGATFSFRGVRNSGWERELPRGSGPKEREKDCKEFCNTQLEEHANTIYPSFNGHVTSTFDCLKSGAFELRSRAIVIHAAEALCNDAVADQQSQCPYASSTCACKFTVYSPAIQMTRVRAEANEEAPNGAYYISPTVSLENLLSRYLPPRRVSPGPTVGKCSIENIAKLVTPISENSNWEPQDFMVVDEGFNCSSKTKLTLYRRGTRRCLCSARRKGLSSLQCSSHNKVNVERLFCQFQLPKSPYRQDVGSSHQQPDETYATSAHDFCQQLNTTIDDYIAEADLDDYIAVFQTECPIEPAPGEESSSRQGEGVCPVDSLQCQPLQFAEHERNPVTFFPFEQPPWVWPAYKDDPQVQQFYSDHYTQVNPNDYNPVAGSSHGQSSEIPQWHHQAPGTSQLQHPGSGEWQYQEQPGQTQWHDQGQHQRQDQEQNQGHNQGQDPFTSNMLWPWPWL